MRDATTIVGLYLTLVGLLASFFWISLGTWLRDLIELRSAYISTQDLVGDARDQKIQPARSPAHRRAPSTPSCGASPFDPRS